MASHPGKTQIMLQLSLGTHTVEDLKKQSHIDNVCKQLARNLFLLGQLKPYVSTHCRKMFFKAHI